jgi:hypothetical protein
MVETILWLIGAITLTILLIRLFGRGAMQWSGQAVGARFRAAEHILEKETAPEQWVRSYRRKVKAIRDRDRDERQVERVAQRARRRCMRKLDGLIRFFEHTPFVDTPGARRLVVRRLQNQRRRLASEEWQAFLALDTDLSTGKQQRGAA